MIYYVSLAITVIIVLAVTIGGPPMLRRIGQGARKIAGQWKRPDALPRPARYKLSIPEFIEYWNGLSDADRNRYEAAVFIYRNQPWPEPYPTMLSFSTPANRGTQLSEEAILSALGAGNFTMRIDQVIGRGADKHKAEVCLANGDMGGPAVSAADVGAAKFTGGAPGAPYPADRRPQIYGQPPERRK